MMKRVACAVVALLFPLSAHAQSLGGTYSVAGTNPNGSVYTGAAQIMIDGPTCTVTMAFGNGDVAGICVPGDGVLAISYVANDALTLILYRVQPDGVLNGVWSVAGLADTGTEVLTPN